MIFNYLWDQYDFLICFDYLAIDHPNNVIIDTLMRLPKDFKQKRYLRKKEDLNIKESSLQIQYY